MQLLREQIRLLEQPLGVQKNKKDVPLFITKYSLCAEMIKPVL